MQYPLWYNEYASLPSRIITSLCGDTYALLEDYYLQGGYRVCATREERNLISYDKRKVGMMVYVASGTTSGTTYFSGNTFWLLINEPVPDPIPPYEYDPNNETPTEDSDWTQLCLFCTTPPPPGPYWTVTPSSREIPTDGTWTADFTVNFYNWTLPTVWWITEPPAGSTFTLSDGSPYYLNLYSGSTDGSTFKASGTTMTYDKGYRDNTIVVWATGLTSNTVQIYQRPLDYNAPVMTQFEIEGPYLVEVGTTISSRKFTWTNSFSENVRSTPYADFQISGDGLPSPVASLPKSSPSNTTMDSTLSFTGLVRTTPGTKGPWTITGYDIMGNTTNLTRQSSLITWAYPIYWGTSSNNNVTTSVEIKAFKKELFGCDIAKGINYTYDFTPVGAQYAYWCYADTCNRVDYFFDPGSNSRIAIGKCNAGSIKYQNNNNNYMFYHVVNVDINGNIVPYKVYRTANPIGVPLNSYIMNLM